MQIFRTRLYKTQLLRILQHIAKDKISASVVLTPKDLKGKISEGVATLKFGIIESFVKPGLPVHDGQGNLIVFMPTNFDRQGELPGKIYSLNYYNAEGKIEGSVGSDFAIRVINPEIDLAKASGFEEWFWDLGFIAEFNGKRENGSFKDLTFDETDQSVEYLGEKYILMLEDFDSATMTNLANEEFGVGDTIIFAFTQDSRIEPTSPEHKVIYLGKPRNDDTSFSYIEYPVYNDDYIVTEPTIVDPINL